MIESCPHLTLRVAGILFFNYCNKYFDSDAEDQGDNGHFVVMIQQESAVNGGETMSTYTLRWWQKLKLKIIFVGLSDILLRSTLLK